MRPRVADHRTPQTPRCLQGSILRPECRKRLFARCLTNYSYEEIRRIKGLKSSQIAKVLGEKPYDEVVHHNNMTTA